MRPVFPAPALSVLRDTQPPVSSTREVLADRYEVLALLGCGGMGCVYRVRDRALDEVVALKMLRKELVTDASIVERFRQEVKLARRVTHENIARVFDIGECRGEKFLTMEYVEGPCLAELVTAGEIIVPRRAIAIARAVASGLAAAHKVGVIHRDLKPENILLGHDGRIVVADFGIARLLESRGGMAHTSDSPVGTPAYMAPEQVEGAADVDARADIYALGVVLFEMLAGRLPFDGATPTAMAMQRLLRDPPHLRSVRPDLPGALSDLVFRAMARSRVDRTASADELEAGLHAVAHMVPDAAPTMPAGFSSRLSLYDVSESMGTDRRVDDVARDLSRVVIGQALESNPVSAPTVAALETFEERRAPAPAPASSHSMKAAHRRATDLAKSVAILPFKNLGPADEEYLSDGLTDDLIDSLSVVSDLRVRPRGMVTRFGRSDLDLRKVGRELDVQAIVEGSVRALGGKVRVSARVVGVHDGFQLWAKRFERPAAEFLVLGDELAQAIASAL
ncbi:MAG: serine/threonine-protein kinase, partial [Polyangiaceae bacterium]